MSGHHAATLALPGFALLVCWCSLAGWARTDDGMDDEACTCASPWNALRHDWTVPTWFGQPAWYKPPLLYWSMFPCGSPCCPLRCWPHGSPGGGADSADHRGFGYRIGGWRPAVTSGLLLLTCSSFVKYSRVGMMEAPPMFFYVAVLYAAYRAWQQDGRRWEFLWPCLLGASSSCQRTGHLDRARAYAGIFRPLRPGRLAGGAAFWGGSSQRSALRRPVAPHGGSRVRTGVSGGASSSSVKI